MSYLVDSDWIIDALNGSSHALALLDRLSANGLAISVVTLGEVYEGTFPFPDTARRIESVRRFLAEYDVLALTDEVMETFARIRYELRRTGQIIPDLDLLIASTALTHDVPLVTRNLRHFQRVAGLSIYDVNDD